MIERYRTIPKESQALYEDKKSRFIASVKPVSSELQAQDFVKAVKSRYRDASHNVYAYIILDRPMVRKFSDDGEPSGTAGLPVMEVIKRQELFNLVLVVTRYFGGTLLGASGLVRAYGKSASLALESSGIVEKVLCWKVELKIEYSLLGRIQNTLINKGFRIENTIYTQDVSIIVSVPVFEFNTFKKCIIEASNGNVLINKHDSSYKDF